MRWLLTVFSILLVSPAWAALLPQFASFRADPVYRGRSARPIFSDPSAYSYRTRILDSAKQPVNFAGHYHLATWGCGTSCAMGAITDAITGRVTMLPFSICCYSGPMDEGLAIIGKPTSRLIVFSGQRNEEGLNGTHFYEFDGREFRFIMSKAARRDPGREPDPAPTPPVADSHSSASIAGADCKKLTEPKARLSCYDQTNAGRPSR